MDLSIGQQAQRSKTITASDVERFASISTDTNPIHLDDMAAAASPFGRRVAHGMLSASLISAVIGMELPGPGAIYLSQTLNFRRPVFLDDTITAHVEVIAIRPDKPIVTLRATVTNQAAEVVLEGEAVVRMP